MIHLQHLHQIWQHMHMLLRHWGKGGKLAVRRWR